MMIKELIIGLTLFGTISNSLGRIGIRVSEDGLVKHTHLVSPSAGIIYDGDIVIEVDGHTKDPLRYIEGEPGQSVKITVMRGTVIKTFDIMRVPKNEIKD